MSPSTRFPVAGSIGTCPETKSRLPALMACEYGPIAAGSAGVEMACRIWIRVMRVVRGEKPACSAAYAALTTLPERRQRVQTRKRLTPPFTIARTRCRFGSNRRGDTLCAWLMFRPTTGPFPQTSLRFAIVLNSSGAIAIPALRAVPAGQAADDAADRSYWIRTLRKIADPVLTNLAAGTLKARMPVEQSAGANRRTVTHLEAVGRLLAGIAPWLELGDDRTAEARIRLQSADMARQGLARGVDPASPDALNFTTDRQPLVD